MRVFQQKILSGDHKIAKTNVTEGVYVTWVGDCLYVQYQSRATMLYKAGGIGQGQRGRGGP